jgi:hypothetical protein
LGRTERVPGGCVCETDLPAGAKPSALDNNKNNRIIKALKNLFLSLVQLARQAWLLPQTAANAVRKRRLEVSLRQHEVERLDRIRNPSKYLGK